MTLLSYILRLEFRLTHYLSQTLGTQNPRTPYKPTLTDSSVTDILVKDSNLNPKLHPQYLYIYSQISIQVFSSGSLSYVVLFFLLGLYPTTLCGSYLTVPSLRGFLQIFYVSLSCLFLVLSLYSTFSSSSPLFIGLHNPYNHSTFNCLEVI